MTSPHGPYLAGPLLGPRQPWTLWQSPCKNLARSIFHSKKMDISVFQQGKSQFLRNWTQTLVPWFINFSTGKWARDTRSVVTVKKKKKKELLCTIFIQFWQQAHQVTKNMMVSLFYLFPAMLSWANSNFRSDFKSSIRRGRPSRIIIGDNKFNIWYGLDGSTQIDVTVNWGHVKIAMRLTYI
jgi:hypothetical protein